MYEINFKMNNEVFDYDEFIEYLMSQSNESQIYGAPLYSDTLILIKHALKSVPDLTSDNLQSLKSVCDEISCKISEINAGLGNSIDVLIYDQAGLVKYGDHQTLDDKPNSSFVDVDRILLLFSSILFSGGGDPGDHELELANSVLEVLNTELPVVIQSRFTHDEEDLGWGYIEYELKNA